MGFSGEGALAGAAVGAPIPFVGPAGGALLGGFFGGGSKKVPGVPTPSGGSEQGSNYSDFADKAYPGTTPWERLGATGSGVASGGYAAQQDTARQAREFKQQRTITDLNNRAHLIAAGTPFGAKTKEDNLLRYGSGVGTKEDVAGDLKAAEVTKAAGQGKRETALGSFAERVGGHFNKGLDAIESGVDKGSKALADFVYNRGSKPRRFQV